MVPLPDSSTWFPRWIDMDLSAEFLAPWRLWKKNSMLCFLSPSAAAPGSPVVRKEVQGNPGATAAAVTRRSTQRPFRSHWGCSILVGALIGRKRSSMTARASSTEGASELESRPKPKRSGIKAHMCTYGPIHESFVMYFPGGAHRTLQTLL